jgi:hypothetical protein
VRLRNADADCPQNHPLCVQMPEETYSSFPLPVTMKASEFYPNH